MIFLCRHGETEWNREKRQQGQKDSPLTEQGKLQAKLLWEELRKAGEVGVIFSSSMERAWRTSLAINEILGAKLYHCELLKEFSFGAFEGWTREERKLEPLASLDWIREEDPIAKFHQRYPEGESYADAEKRAREFLEQIGTRKNYAVVAHETINRMLVKNLLGLSIEESMAVSHPNDCVYRIVGTDVWHKKTGEEGSEWKEGLLLNT